MSLTAMRNRYVSDAVTTASPARLVCMLYDRLVRDLTQAEEAIAAGDRAPAGEALLHAQDIVGELVSGLDPSKWEGAPGLAGLYAWWLRELIAGNVRQDAARIEAVRLQVEPLRDAWHQAAAALAGS